MTCERCREDVEAGRLCVPCFTVVHGPPPSCETPEQVARAFREAAKRPRRRYTLADGWQQRPGVTTFDRGYGLGFR